MIHTLELKIQISHEEYADFINGKSNYAEYNSKVSKDTTLEEVGFTWLKAMKTPVPGRPDYYSYVLKVNPCKLLGRDDITQIYDVSQCDDVIAAFNQRIKEFNRDLPPLDGWNVSRVDYTKNIHTEFVELYIKLFQKADLEGYSFSKQKRFRKGSLWCIKKPRSQKENHIINFYDKYDEVCKRDYYTDEEREQAKNVLRIEVECSRVKMNTIRRKFNLEPNCAEQILRRKDIADYVINYYVRKILKPEPYYKRSVAEGIIEKSSIQRSNKDKMKLYIREIAKQYSSVDKVREMFPKDKKLCADQFKRLGINRVTIMDKEKGINRFLPSILDLL